MAELHLDSFRPPKRETWWRTLFVLHPGDVWEQRINEWGVWDAEPLRRWVWDGRAWNEVPID